MRAEPGSFRDPGGRIYWYGDRVLRTVMPSAAADFEYVESSGLIPHLVERGMLIAQTQRPPELLGDAAGVRRICWSIPSSTSFLIRTSGRSAALQAAALLQLDLYLEALERDVTLSDATAYNIQFDGVRPVFIDRLSFRRYVDGQFWLGHRQFCEQFLNPLLLRAKFGIPHNAWLRGSPEGIGAAELSALLPLRQKLSWRVLTNVVMQGSLQKTRSSDAHKAVAGKLRFPKPAFVRMLRGLRAWIESLHPADRRPTTWQAYARQHFVSRHRSGGEAQLRRTLRQREQAAHGLGHRLQYRRLLGCSAAGRRALGDRLRLRPRRARSCVRSRAIRAHALPAAVPRRDEPGSRSGMESGRAPWFAGARDGRLWCSRSP